MIYLDSAATNKYRDVDDIIVDTITYAMKNYWQNPSSLYASHVKKEIDRCRKVVADFIGATPDEIIFTSGASESNNLALRGWSDFEVYDKSIFVYGNTYIFITPIEHKSIFNAVDNAISIFYDCDVDEKGFVDCASLEGLLKTYKDDRKLISVGMANSEIGVIQNIRNISNLVHKYGGILHVDATQAIPYIPINVKDLGIDMLSASGHKLSPVLKGVGFLYKKKDINIRPLIGGAQEGHIRGGTENTFGIIGLAKAVELCDISDSKINKLCEKRDDFINLLETKFNCKLNGARINRLPNNINVTFPQNITGESLLYTLDLSGIKCGIGSACNSKSIEPSHVLKAIGLSDEEAMKTVRFTLPEDITYEEIDFVVNEIDKSLKLIEMIEE